MKVSTLLVLDAVLVLSAAVFSIATYVAMSFVQESIPPAVTLSPVARFVMNYSFLVHCPLALLLVLSFANGFGRVTQQREWSFCVGLVFLSLALLAALFLIGATNPFWVIR